MKILLANSFFYPATGGIENYLLNFGRTLVRSGHDVTVLTRQHNETLGRLDCHDGISIRRFHFRANVPPFNLLDPFRLLAQYRRRFKELLKLERFDLIVVRDVYSLSACGQSLPILPVIYVQATAYPLYLEFSYQDRGHSPLARSFWWTCKGIWRFALGRVERKCLGKCRQRVVLSDAKRTEICRYYRISESTYHVIPPGVDANKYVPPRNPAHKRELRARLSLPDSDCLFLYVGRFSAEKNPKAVLEALKLARDRSLSVVFVGPHHGTEFSDYATRLGVQDQIVLVGEKLEPVEYFQAADVLLLPSLTEGFGQVILESMACGVPCIAFRNPPNSCQLATEEVIEDGCTGLLVSYSNDNDFASAMLRMAGNRTFVAELAKNCIDRARKYSWSTLSQQILSLDVST